jgi:hypothetical protein
MPVTAGLETRLPNGTELAVQFTSGTQSYLLEHCITEFAAPVTAYIQNYKTGKRKKIKIVLRIDNQQDE